MVYVSMKVELLQILNIHAIYGGVTEVRSIYTLWISSYWMSLLGWVTD